MARNRHNGRRQKKVVHKGQAVAPISRPINKEKKIAISGRDGQVPAAPVVNALNDVVSGMFWDYLKRKGKDAQPTMEQLFAEFPGKQSLLTARLNDALGALHSSLSQGVPTSIEGGESNDEWDLMAELFAEPAKFKAIRADGKPWGALTLLDYGNDRPESSDATE